MVSTEQDMILFELYKKILLLSTPTILFGKVKLKLSLNSISWEIKSLSYYESSTITGNESPFFTAITTTKSFSFQYSPLSIDVKYPF